VLCDPGLRQELITRGRRQASRYSWERTAREVLSIYQEIAEERTGSKHSH
jgi:hypothetical protein